MPKYVTRMAKSGESESYAVKDVEAREAISAETEARQQAVAAETEARQQAVAAEENARQADISVIKSALRESNIDVLSYGAPVIPYENKGITMTKIKDMVFHFVGTISGSAFNSFYESTTDLPYWLIPGETYFLEIKGATANNKIYFDVLGFAGGSTQHQFTGYCQENGKYYFTIPSNWTGGVYVRAGWLNDDAGTQVSETIEYHIYHGYLNGAETSKKAYGALSFSEELTSNPPASCDDVPVGTELFVQSSHGVLAIEDFPFDGPGTLLCFGNPDWPIQLATDWNKDHPTIKSRSRGLNNVWSNWYNNSNNMRIMGWLDPDNPDQDDLDDLADNEIWYVATISGQSGIDHYPYNCPGIIQNYVARDAIKWQLAYPWNVNEKLPKYRVKQNGTWTSWVDIGGGGQTITITQEVSRDTYNNEYNISVNPQITTDSNGWLQPVDTNTADETGKTDMTSAIMAMLNSTGYCHLAPGIYYVSGNIDMPADSMIEGCGKQTIIRLLQTQTSAYIVRMHTRSTLKNVCLSGGYSAGDISDGNIGGRRGIQYIGNRDGQDTGVTPATCTLCQIEGCWFENLDSGFYGYNAGGGLQEGVEMVNCYFTRCKAGINIDYWTEYCKFTNCVTFQCYYACINNGGNNVFTACTFHGVVGFVIDNSSGTKTNNAHGTANGCTFNHIDNMNNPEQLGKGYGVKVIDSEAGFVFSNCQFWYGRIYVENSPGVQLTGCEFGGLGNSSYPLFEFSGAYPVFVNDCIFTNTPETVITSQAKFSNCWTYMGVAVGQ